MHTALAFAVGVAVGLSCIAVGAALGNAFETHPIGWVGVFLLAYGWVIGILAGLWYLLKGPNAPADDDRGERSH